jgi:diguanylate cyclase (GGDEF)-like protein
VTTALAAVAAGLAVLAAVLLALLVLRSRRSGRRERQNRLLGELTSSLDFDEVVSRTLDAAAALPGAEAALLSIRGPEEKSIVAALGLSAQDAAREASRPSGKLSANDYPMRSHCSVQLEGEAGELGSLTVFSLSQPRSFEEHVRADLEALASLAARAIENAKRFSEARQLADLDALTSLHNRRYFHETLAREVARAQRYGRKLALIVFDLDDFKAVNDRVGHLGGDSVLADAAERVRDVVRSADVACRVGGDEFAVILPESTLADADQLYRRIQAAVAARPMAWVGKLHLSAGVAELRSDDDARSFFERADKALYRAKSAGKDQVVAAS